MNVKVTDDGEFMRRGSSKRKERIKIVKKNGEWFRKKGCVSVGDNNATNT